MNNRCKVSPIYIFTGIIAMLLSGITLKSTAVVSNNEPFRNILTVLQQDTVPPPTLKRPTLRNGDSSLLPVSGRLNLKDTIPTTGDSLRGKDSVVQRIDTLDIKISRDSLDAPVNYQAEDSIVWDIKKNKAYMYGKGVIEYKDVNLTADRISLDQTTQLVTATYTLDTAGAQVGVPKLKQAETPFTADTIVYNFKTQRGITKTTFTQQGEMFVAGEKIKKVNENDYFALRATVTTCNYDHPHFAFKANKMKLVNKKLAVTGPIHPEFEGVPIPLYLPFGLFPMSKGGRQSGILAPTFSTNEQFGLGLEGLGYYKVLNDNFDVTLLTNVYSYGGWSVNVQPTYRKRYRYQGGMTFRMQDFKVNFKGDPDYTQTKTFNITWNHSVDGKARPGQTFSASVNAGSTKFNQYIPNNPTANFNNNLNSSIAYSKTWEGVANLTASANHNQNAVTRLVQLNLPDIGFTVNTLYPFQREEMVGQAKWYEKLGVGLNTNFRSMVSFYDSAFSFRQLIDTFQWGASHNVPITLSLPPLGPLQIAPSVSFDERWYAQEFIRQWNPVDGKVDTIINKGFYSARQMAFGLGFNTAIFGTKNFKNSRLVALRHVIRPSVGLNYRPDFQKDNYYTSQVDTSGRAQRFSRFDGSIFGGFGEGTFGGMSFGVDNNLEMKIRSKKDTGDAAIKKVRLIDGFGFNGSYNFMADSFKLSDISLYIRSTLFEKLNITANGNLSPYKVDAQGYRLKEYMWEGRKFSPGALGRITGGSIAMSTSFSSKPKDDKKQKEKEELEDELGPLTAEEQQAQLDFARRNPGEFADFNIPWSINTSFSLSFQRIPKRDYSGFETVVNSNLNLGGDFNLTEKWKMGANTFFDFKTGKIQSFTMFITREMHCWQMSINITPVGLYRFFNITLQPKSGLLRDLKVNRTRYFYTGF